MLPHRLRIVGYMRALVWGTCLLIILPTCSVALKRASARDTVSVSSGGGGGGESCGGALNIGLDYFLRSKLFANLTKIDLPTEIPLPLSTFKIVNMRLTGLETVARGCNLQLSLAGEGKIRVKACGRAGKIMVSFVLKAAGYPVDFVKASLTDTSVSAQALIVVAPGGQITLESFDVKLGGIDVENAGITGTIITKIMKLGSMKEKVRSAIVTQGLARIKAELKKFPLPE